MNYKDLMDACVVGEQSLSDIIKGGDVTNAERESLKQAIYTCRRLCSYYAKAHRDVLKMQVKTAKAAGFDNATIAKRFGINESTVLNLMK